jgi:hypothetical protein
LVKRKTQTWRSTQDSEIIERKRLFGTIEKYAGNCASIKMKKLLLIVIVLSFLASCGPHRMSCGARGICDTSEKQIVPQSKINHNSQIEKI